VNNVLQVLVAVLNSLWQTALAAALVWLALKFLRINAATRYIIWWATLAVVLVLPVAPRILQALRPTAKHSSTATVTPVTPTSVAAPTIVEAPAIVTLQQQRSATWPLWLLALWGAMFLFRMTQIVRSYIYLRGVKRRSALSSQSLPAITRSAKLLLSADVSSPMAVGFVEPAVILPASLPEELEKSELEHVLLHETAHIARNDDWTNLAARVLGAALALHPVAVWILRQIEQEREMACDDWVVARTGAAKPYAASLARMFELRWSRRRKLPNLNLASGIFGSGSCTGERIEMLLKRGRDFSPRASVARVATSAVVLLTFVVAGSHAPRWIAFAQQSDRPSYEVASVKLNTSGTDREYISMPPNSSMLTATNFKLRTLVLIAYQVDEPRIIGGPEWISTAGFDIVAKPPQGAPDVVRSRRMLQALLEDRFKLRVRRETREVPVYALLPTKNGIRLSDAKEGGCAVVGPSSPLPPPKAGQSPLPPCGGTLRGPNILAGGKSSMADFVFALSNVLGRPVIDKTGYTGTFSYRLEFAPERISALPGDAGTSDPSRPSIFTAVQDQLGLKLESQKGPAEVLVIDHVEKPEAN
jgi:uncharacterized protein (TIGR03435 family)